MQAAAVPRPVGALLVAALCLAAPASAGARQSRMRLVIGTNVACRTEPDSAAPVQTRHTLGDTFLAGRESETESGTWILDTWQARGASPGCWVYGALTTPWSDRERALLAAADHVLARTGFVPFEDYVRIDNLLSQTRAGAHADSTVLETSPLLQLRRLQVLDRAAGAPGTGRVGVQRDPLKTAWFFAHRDVLRYHEPDGRWILAADVYWRLYERHRDTPWAEEMAWAAARGVVPGDECSAACVLDRVNRTYARYWAAFPRGRRVGEALARARRLIAAAVRTKCRRGRSGGTREQADRVRHSLAAVTAPGKASLLADLGELERPCGDPSSSNASTG